VDIDNIKDEVSRKATIAQISSYGQTPRQLFRRPHPARVWREPDPTVFSHPDKLWADLLWTTPFEIGRLEFLNDQPLALKTNRVRTVSKLNPLRFI
jgi:hypothetical protein